MNQKLSMGSIFSVKNDTRKLVVVGYGNNDMYIVCVCNENEIEISKPYLIPATQIDRVLSLGYVSENTQNILTQNNNQVNSIPQPGQKSGGYIFDENGIVIG